MDLHRGARTCPRSRALIVERLNARESVTEVAGAFGVSRTTVYEWRRRYESEGQAGLMDRRGS